MVSRTQIKSLVKNKKSFFEKNACNNLKGRVKIKRFGHSLFKKTGSQIKRSGNSEQKPTLLLIRSLQYCNINSLLWRVLGTFSFKHFFRNLVSLRRSKMNVCRKNQVTIGHTYVSTYGQSK